MSPSATGLDPLKDLFEQILTRLEALEAKVGVASAGGSSRSLSGGSSHGKPAAKPGQKRLSIVHGE